MSILILLEQKFIETRFYFHKLLIKNKCMKIKRTSSTPFFAEITAGRQIGYSEELIADYEVVKFIQDYQDDIIEKKNIWLSVSLSECRIILSGQVEPHFKVRFINYPKFPLPVDKLKKEVEEFAKAYLSRFRQNRIVIEYAKETVMLEKSEVIDPRIKIS